MKKGFTLAEVIIVLTVIGFLAAILIPVAFQAAPDENVLRFKKAYNTLGTIIRELTTSDKYYLNGDLGIKPNNDPSNKGATAGTEDNTYFCETLAELLSVKEKDCEIDNNAGDGYVLTFTAPPDGSEGVDNTANAKLQVDALCLEANKGAQIITVDGISWYEANQPYTFSEMKAGTSNRVFSPVEGNAITYKDKGGFDAAYKVVCFDVDGVDSEDVEESKKTEAPFGFGIRSDGKILSGARADEWAKKSVQKGDKKEGE